MNVLVITQIIDRKDPQLGFFVRWVEELSRVCSVFSVVCLKKGVELPQGISVYSLGKTGRQSPKTQKFLYAWRFLRYVWVHRAKYDVVFVHMNEEYVLLAGVMWKMLGKRVYLWRNHYAGSWKTHIVAHLSSKVFYTSHSSYTARFRNSVPMPVGVEIPEGRDKNEKQKKSSILFLARFDESKHPMLLVEALGILKQKKVLFTATFAGGPSDPLSDYPNQVKERARELGVLSLCEFTERAVPNTEKWNFFARHEIFVNCSRSGMFDKTMFEAAACGAIVVSSSADWEQNIGSETAFKDGDKEDLARVLQLWVESKKEQKEKILNSQSVFVKENSLETLSTRLVSAMEVP